MATIKIPPVLRASVGGEKQVGATGENVGEVLRDLASNHPATASQLFSAEGELNRYVNVYLNDEDVRVLDGLETTVALDACRLRLKLRERPERGRRLPPGARLEGVAGEDERDDDDHRLVVEVRRQAMRDEQAGIEGRDQ